FLVDLPHGMKSVGFGNMTSFPGYGYTARVKQEGAALTVSDRDYEYYHKLYFLTRTELPRWLVRAIGKSSIFRRYPQLLDRFLPAELPSFFLVDNDDARRQ